MSKQVIIAIGREYGSGGHEIGKQLAERMGISFYDRNMLDEIAKEMNVDAEKLQKYDERRKIPVVSRTVRGFSNSPEEAVAEFQFDYIKKKAENGESFVVVGRCAEYVLRTYNLISIFVLGDEAEKSKRVQAVRNVSDNEALSIMKRHDRTRKYYHNHHCDTKWGDSRGYDITINSSKLGLEKTISLLEDYINTRMESMK